MRPGRLLCWLATSCSQKDHPGDLHFSQDLCRLSLFPTSLCPAMVCTCHSFHVAIKEPTSSEIKPEIFFWSIAFWTKLLMPHTPMMTLLRDALLKALLKTAVFSQNPCYDLTSRCSISCSLGYIFPSACPHVSSWLVGELHGTTPEHKKAHSSLLNFLCSKM